MLKAKSGGRPAVAWLLIALAAWLLPACADGAAGSFEPSAEGTLTVATAEVPAPGFWEGTAEAPNGGFEFELADELRERFELDSLQIVEVPFSEIVAGELGGADLALSLVTPTAERDRVLDFSDPYLLAEPALLTSVDVEIPDLETARELRYAVETSTTLEEILADSIDPTPEVTVTPNRGEALAALSAGDVDTVMLDLPAAAAIAEQSGGDLAVAAKLDTDETIAAALPEGEQANAEAVSSAIRALSADGTLAELGDRWLGPGIADGGSTIPLLRTRR
jgi:polar amino acid transport system substrate-binding protein